MSAPQRLKGHRYERDIAKFYRDCGLKAHRGQQADSTVKPPDVVLPEFPALHVECGRRAVGCWVIDKWEQAKGDAGNGVPIVHVRSDGGDDLVVLSLEHWGRIVRSQYGGPVESQEVCT